MIDLRHMILCGELLGHGLRHCGRGHALSRFDVHSSWWIWGMVKNEILTTRLVEIQAR